MDNIKDKKIPNVPNLRFGLEEFKPTKIKNLLTICNGQDQKKIENENGKNPILGTGGIIGYTNSYLYDKPSVCIGRKGTIDKPIFIDKPFWTVDTLFWSKINSAFNPKFIYYLFQTINWKFYNQSTSVPSLTSAVIENIGVNVPNIRTQNKIADFLSKIDEQINTQIKIIEDLKALKESISYHYFGDNGILSKICNKVKLSKILYERKAYDVKESCYPHATLSKEGISEKTDRYNRDFLVKDEEKKYKITHLNDICYNPANLKFGVICLNTYGDAIFSPIYVTYEVKYNDPYFISLYLTNPTFIGHVRKYEQGTVYERMAVSSEDFLKATIFLPTMDEQKRIAKIFMKIDDKITLENLILEKYKEQKKYLLSNMFI